MTNAEKPKSDLKRSGTRRLGNDYQDAFALDVLIDWLEHSDRYRWVRVEADDFSCRTRAEDVDYDELRKMGPQM